MAATAGFAGSHQDIHSVLKTTRLADVLPSGHKQSVVTLEHATTIGDALKVLAQRNIISAPLVIQPSLEEDVVGSADISEDGALDPVLAGWLDVRDILASLIRFLHEQHEHLPTSMLQLMALLDKEAASFTSRMLITVQSSEDRSLVYKADADTPLLDVIKDQFLSVRRDGRVLHRIAVFDEHGSITHIVSQMDIVRYLLSTDALGPIGLRTVEQLGLVAPAQANITTVDPHTPTLLAFEKLLKAGVSGAPVVTGTGQMIANLSISDLKRIQPEHLGVLALPVAEFLAVQHQTTYLGYSASGSEQAAHPFFAPTPAPVAGANTSPAYSPSPARALSGSIAHMPSGGIPAVGGSAEAPGSGDVASMAVAAALDEVRTVTCAPSTTLNEVMRIMAATHVHRVYVLQPDAKPLEVIAVITPTDLLQLIVAV